MLGNLNGPTLVVILLIVLLLFGAPKLPGLAKSLGQSMRILKKEVGSGADEPDDVNTPDAATGRDAAPSARTQPKAQQTDRNPDGDSPTQS